MLSLASPSVLSVASAAPAQFLPRAIARRTPPARCVSFFDGDEAEEEAYLAELEEQLLRTTGRRAARRRRRRRRRHQRRRGGPPTSPGAAGRNHARPLRALRAGGRPAARRRRARPRDRTSRRGARVASVPGKVSRASGLPEQAGPAAAPRRARARLRLLPRGLALDDLRRRGAVGADDRALPARGDRGDHPRVLHAARARPLADAQAPQRDEDRVVLWDRARRAQAGGVGRRAAAYGTRKRGSHQNSNSPRPRGVLSVATNRSTGPFLQLHVGRLGGLEVLRRHRHRAASARKRGDAAGRRDGGANMPPVLRSRTMPTGTRSIARACSGGTRGSSAARCRRAWRAKSSTSRVVAGASCCGGGHFAAIARSPT